MMAPILVTGGTGTLGRHVVPLLRDKGASLRVLSRSRNTSDGDVHYVSGDLTSGGGVDAAMAGVDTVVHLAGTSKGDEVKARTLVAEAKRAGVTHIVYISVVGADRTPVVSRVDRAMFGYIEAKREAEKIIAESGIPWTTLRATQFHDLMLTTAQQLAKLPVVPVPSGTRVQPVDAAEVAEQLVELALGEPRGLVPDLAGPHIYVMADVIRSYFRAVGKRRPIMPMRMPGRAAAAFRGGANLAPDRAVGVRTWEDFLAATL
jgi:uncharacterized protein YbjT (DUF2867 family)